MLREREVDLNERPPFRALGLADKMHPGFLRSAIGLQGVALDTRADDIFPSSWPATIAWDDMVQIEIFAVAGCAAILAGILVALKNIVPGELHLLFGHMVVNEQQNDPGDPQAKGNGSN